MLLAGVGLMAARAVIVWWGARALKRDPNKAISYCLIAGVAMLALGGVLTAVGLVGCRAVTGKAQQGTLRPRGGSDWIKLKESSRKDGFGRPQMKPQNICR